MTAPADLNAPHRPEKEAGSGVEARRVVGGGAVLTITMLVTGIGNYAINALLARWLGPDEFGDASVLVTLLLIVTAIAGCFQLVAARETSDALGRGDEGTATVVRQRVLRWALAWGFGLGAITVLGASLFADVFNFGSAWAIAIFGFGLPLYVWQSVHRGVLQGRLGYGSMAITFVAEMVVRVVVTVTLVQLGWGIEGVAWGLTLSFLASLVSARMLVGPADDNSPAGTPNLAGAFGATTVLLLAQIVLNNGDMLLVKQGFSATDAGIYAVVALLGRAVFFLSWSVVTTVFPASARADDASGKRLLIGGIALLSLGGAVASAMFWFGGRMIVEMLFSSTYVDAAELLGPYVLATSILTVTNFIATVELAANRLLASRLMIVAAIIQSITVYVTSSLDVVVWSQVAIQSALLAAMLIGARRAKAI